MDGRGKSYFCVAPPVLIVCVRVMGLYSILLRYYTYIFAMLAV